MNYIIKPQDDMFAKFDEGRKPLDPADFEPTRVIRVKCKGEITQVARKQKDSGLKKFLAAITLRKVRKDDVCAQ